MQCLHVLSIPVDQNNHFHSYLISKLIQKNTCQFTENFMRFYEKNPLKLCGREQFNPILDGLCGSHVAVCVCVGGRGLQNCTPCLNY